MTSHRLSQLNCIIRSAFLSFPEIVIAIVAVGGVLLIVFISILLCTLCRRRRKRRLLKSRSIHSPPSIAELGVHEHKKYQQGHGVRGRYSAMDYEEEYLMPSCVGNNSDVRNANNSDSHYENVADIGVSNRSLQTNGNATQETAVSDGDSQDEYLDMGSSDQREVVYENTDF